MPVAFENLTRDVNMVSDRSTFQLSSKKPGAGFALLSLEQAYAGLLAHEKFGLTASDEALGTTRKALVTAYQGVVPDPEKEVQAFEEAVREKLSHMTPAKPRAIE